MSKVKEIEKEPAATIGWAAHHLFSPEFYRRYKNDLLNDLELCYLFAAALIHVQQIHKDRFFFEFRMKRFDRKRIFLLTELHNYSLGKFLNTHFYD